MEVDEKIEEMQKYIPCLKLLIESLDKNPAKAEQVKKMKYLLEMLLNKDSSIKLDTLIKCEGILQKVYGKEQMLSSKAEAEAKNAANNKPGSESNEPKLVNGNSSDPTVGDGSQVQSKDASIDEAKKDPVGENDDAKGGGDSVTAVNSNELSNSVAEVQDGTDNTSNEVTLNSLLCNESIPATPCTEIIIEKAESLNSSTLLNKPEMNTILKTGQLNNDIESTNPSKNSSETELKKLQDDAPIVVNEPIAGGECDMDIDEELTSKTLKETSSSESQKKDDIVNNKTKDTTASIHQDATSTSTAKINSAKSTFVDLTSDDSNDGSPTTPSTPSKPSTVKTVATSQKLTPTGVNNQIETILLQPTKASEKPAVVYLIKSKSNDSQQEPPPPSTPTTPSTPSAPGDPSTVDNPSSKDSETEPKNNIMTIDLLDSDSDDEGKSNSKNKSPVSSGNVQMPTPKMLGDKPMFTIASVQSISNLQEHQEKRREVEKELYAIVKTIQFTTHHTVPQKHNAAVRAYLERFIKDLMFEKNRVNLCLQKLLKTLDPEKYKHVKKIIQTYCSEPVNDPNLPAPSPFCHRIKVYPEKLQFVMRQMFFFNTGISVVGYKVYSIANKNQLLNGMVKSPTVETKKTTQSSQTSSTPKIINQRRTLPSPSILQKITNAPAGTLSFPRIATSTSDISMSKKKTILIPPLPRSSGAASQGGLHARSSAASERGELARSPVASEGGLLAPMRTQMVPSEHPTPKAKRRKHDSDNDDDADENYVPQGYFSESEEVTEGSTDTPRRTSLQRASKKRCQEYLELERSIDDETYIRATEARLAKALKGDGKPRTTNYSKPSTPGNQPPLKKHKSASSLTKKKKSSGIEDEDSRASQDSESKEKDEMNDDDSQPAAKRRKKSDKKKADGEEDMDQEEAEEEEDDEPAPVLDFSVENKAKNVTRAYHCRSKYIDRCLICHERSGNRCVIPHYVNAHRDREVFISRLSKSDILKLQSETMCFAFPSSNAKSSAYVAYCIFCQQEQCLSMKNWYEHYTRHTGEYLYECSNCQARRSTRQQLKRHLNMECSKKGSELLLLKEIDQDIARIDACVCMLCNYIQLDFERLVKHLKEEHEFPGAIHEVPEGTYQLLNLLRIEQNYYESAQYDDNVNAENVMASVPEDDMSYMICNMLASTNDQVSNNTLVADTNEGASVSQVVSDPLVSGEPKNDQQITDPLQSDEILNVQVVTDIEDNLTDKVSENTNGDRVLSPEMITPDDPPVIPVIDDTGKEVAQSLSGESTLNETGKNVEEKSTSQSELSKNQSQLESKSLDQDQGSGNSMEALQMEEDSTESVSELLKTGDLDASKTTEDDQISTEDAIEEKSNPSFDDDTSKPSLEITKIIPNEESTVDERDPLDTSSSQVPEKSKSLLSELNSLEDLSKSATESIFQRVSESLINSVYESVEVATTVSESTSDLADSNAISSENTMDSEESCPQFLESNRSPVDPVLMTVHETIVPDLDGAVESNELVEEEAGETNQEANRVELNDSGDLILPESMENSTEAGNNEDVTDELIIPECNPEVINGENLYTVEDTQMEKLNDEVPTASESNLEADETTTDETTIGSTVYEGTTGEETPAEQMPEEEMSAEETPAEEKLAKETPAEETPAEETSAQETLAEKAPAEVTSAEETPAEETSGEETSAKETPAEETSAEETLAEETPADETPAEETPAEETSAKKTSVEETPAEETPAEETPAEETPAEETPAKETPAEEMLAEETPSEETVAAEKTTDETETGETAPEETTAEETTSQGTAHQETADVEMTNEEIGDKKDELDSLPAQVAETSTNNEATAEASSNVDGIHTNIEDSERPSGDESMPSEQLNTVENSEMKESNDKVQTEDTESTAQSLPSESKK